jgi:5-methyltetrahydrofolate--homocysteine methyltransferase
MPTALVTALAEMREQEALEIARRRLDGGHDPAAILDQVREGMDLVGQRFEAGEYFLPELILAGEMVRQVSDLVTPALAGREQRRSLGKVLIGTVEGDIHDIGKDIVVFMLESAGFEVVDLGVDVSPARFVGAIREHEPDVVGLSALLTVAYDSMRRTVDAIKDAGLYDAVRIMIGGGHTTDAVREYAGAHGFGADAMAAVRLAKRWTEGR